MPLNHIRPRKFGVLLVALLLLYMAISPTLAWTVYNTILFRPHKVAHCVDVDMQLKEIEYSFKAHKRDVVFPSANGKMLHGCFFELPKTKRVFLVSHGKGGNIYKKIHIARALLQCGGSVLLYDYQGYGDSEGSPSLDGVCEDVVAAYDYLVEHEHRTSKDIIGYGESLGTGITGQLVLRRKVGGVILHSGCTSLLRAGRDTLPWLWFYPDASFPRQMLDNVAVFTRRHPPLLIVHGKRDKRLPYCYAEDLFRKAIPPKALLTQADGDHTTFGNEFCAAVAEFLNQNNL